MINTSNCDEERKWRLRSLKLESLSNGPWAIVLGVSFIRLSGVSDGILAEPDSKRMDGLVKSGTGRSTAEQIRLNM